MNRAFVTVAIVGACAAGACTTSAPAPPPEVPAAAAESLVARAFPERQLTGVAVNPEGRVFVNFPRWGGPHDVSVAEVLPDGSLRPYPNADWNAWDTALAPDAHWICVQSVWVGPEGDLWILDPAAPGLGEIVPGGPKLVRVDLATDEVVRVYPFDLETAPQGSYLNDVRIQPDGSTAYITDSGRGAMIVLDLASGAARRLLEEHPALHAEADVVPVIGGRELRLADGSVPAIHADGIALSPDGERLYFHALTGRRLWAVATGDLQREDLDDAALAERLVDLGETVVTDGMLAAPDGSVLHTALEHDAIVAWHPDGRLETVFSHPLLAWPDSLAWGPDGALYVTTSRIHQSERFGGVREQPYHLLRLPPADVTSGAAKR